MKPTYEDPLETAADLIKRDITLFLIPGGEIYRQVFAASSDPNYQELSRRLVIAKDWDEYQDMLRKVTSTGLYANIGTVPDLWFVPEEEYKYWYRSSDTLAGGGETTYGVHLANKKWPLKKVL